MLGGTVRYNNFISSETNHAYIRFEYSFLLQRFGDRSTPRMSQIMDELPFNKSKLIVLWNSNHLFFHLRLFDL